MSRTTKSFVYHLPRDSDDAPDWTLVPFDNGAGAGAGAYQLRYNGKPLQGGNFPTWEATWREWQRLHPVLDLYRWPRALSPAEARRRPDAQPASPVTLTLTQVQEQTGISATALVRYKRAHALGGVLARFVVGSGRRMRFAPESLPTFLRLRREGIASRGRRKTEAQRQADRERLALERMASRARRKLQGRFNLRFASGGSARLKVGTHPRFGTPAGWKQQHERALQLLREKGRFNLLAACRPWRVTDDRTEFQVSPWPLRLREGLLPLTQRWQLTRNNGRRYVVRTEKAKNGRAVRVYAARELTGAAKGQRVLYRDGNTLNLEYDNLVLRGVPRGDAAPVQHPVQLAA